MRGDYARLHEVHLLLAQQPPEVYNLRNDIPEQHNIADQYSEKQLQQWRKALLHWHARAAALFEGSQKK